MSGKKGRSGRRKVLGTQIDEAMKLLDASLPGLVAKLSELAEKGDREALIYLIDRRMGKPRQQTELDIKGGSEIASGTMIAMIKLLASERRKLIESEQRQLEAPKIEILNTTTPITVSPVIENKTGDKPFE